MATKVIKLQDNNNILIPVTDASVVQISVEGQVKSVKDVIIENEEVTAAGYNNLNSRVIALEKSPGIDKVGTITDVKVNSTSVVSNGVANIPKATNNKLGTVALGYTNSNNGYALKVDSNGKGYVNVPWTDSKTTVDGHYNPTGAPTNATYVNGNLTQSTGSVPLTHGSSLVITGVKYNKDAKGHVTDISYSLGKLPSVSDTRVAFMNTSDSNKYPLIFKYSTGSTKDANAVRFDSATDSAYYVASTHSAFIHTTYHAASYLAGNEMVGFKTVNSNMNALSLFSSTGASSTLGVMFRDRYNNAILPVTSSDMIEVNYGGTSKILTSLLQENEQVTTEALIDLYNRINNYSADFATISYQASSLSSGGVVSGVVKNNLNRTSGNITTIRTVDEVEQPNGGTGTARTILRYETPLINIAKGTTYTYTDGVVDKTGIKSTFPAPSSTTVNKNYYDPIVNNTKKANIYGTGSTNVTYAPMVDGNNYCDVSNSTYEMYFFNTNKLRNYLTAYARIDINKSYLKEINEDTVFQWGDDSDNYIQETLTLKKGEISFNKEYIESSLIAQPVLHRRTSITPQSIRTNTFTAYASNAALSAYIKMSGESIEVFYDNKKVVSIAGDQSTFNHTAYAVKFMETSDERLKTNISPIAYDPDGIGIYSFIKNNYDSYSYGFIAQNIAETHPELVSENTVTSYLAVDYDATLSLLLAKALNRIDALEKRVLELEKAEINDPNLI